MDSDNKNNLRRIVIAAVFAALVYSTTLIAIPLPRGNINFGECCVLLCGIMLGPWGAVSAAVGAALADITLGYMIYVPATVVIKALTALAVYFLIKLFSGIFRQKYTLPAIIISSVIAEVVMVGGYFLYELVLSQNLAVSAATIPTNCMQAAAGIIAANIIYAVLPGKIKHPIK